MVKKTMRKKESKIRRYGRKNKIKRSKSHSKSVFKKSKRSKGSKGSKRKKKSKKIQKIKSGQAIDIRVNPVVGKRNKFSVREVKMLIQEKTKKIQELQEKLGNSGGDNSQNKGDYDSKINKLDSELKELLEDLRTSELERATLKEKSKKDTVSKKKLLKKIKELEEINEKNENLTEKQEEELEELREMVEEAEGNIPIGKVLIITGLTVALFVLGGDVIDYFRGTGPEAFHETLWKVLKPLGTIFDNHGGGGKRRKKTKRK